MTTPRRPSMADRTMSFPLSVNNLSSPANSGRNIQTPQIGAAILTPPSSPRYSRSSSNLSSGTVGPLADSLTNDSPEHNKTDSTIRERDADGILICPYGVEILRDHQGRNLIFGYGAWSNVLKATCYRRATSGLMTPPLSPGKAPPLLVAVKQPARKDALTILRSEAKVLDHLMSTFGHEQFVVGFHGLLLSDSSLVLEAMPWSLEDHIKKSAVTAGASRTTWNMTEPVIGNTTVWLDLADKLVSALSWLHNTAMIVHGDIKPGNILLNRTAYEDIQDGTDGDTCFPYTPLFADFSSSQRLDSNPTPNTLSAITREYTAPELLSSKVLSNPDSTATTASDVFSLAVTLLVAASGNTMVYSGSGFQRQAMAIQGWMVIQAVRNGPFEEGARVPRQGVVERTLDRAVLKAGMGRIDAASWKAKIEETKRRDPNKL